GDPAEGGLQVGLVPAGLAGPAGELPPEDAEGVLVAHVDAQEPVLDRSAAAGRCRRPARKGAGAGVERAAKARQVLKECAHALGDTRSGAPHAGSVELSPGIRAVSTPIAPVGRGR